jgi:hypothetical protein
MANAARNSVPHLQIAPAPGPMPAPQPGPVLLDDPFAPEFFASACCGFSIGQGNVTLTFETGRCNHFDANSTMSRVVVGRVIMPAAAAQALVLQLNAALEQSGLSPSQAAAAGMQKQ